jgi:hypothetical protein
MPLLSRGAGHWNEKTDEDGAWTMSHGSATWCERSTKRSGLRGASEWSRVEAYKRSNCMLGWSASEPN